MTAFQQFKNELSMWLWANQHPYLFTAINVLDPYLFVVVLFAGYKLISGLMKMGKREDKGRRYH